MEYNVSEHLRDFRFWSGAEDRANLLTCRQFDIVESMMEEIAPEQGWTYTAINDFFWFEFDTIAQWLGYKNEEYLEKDISNSEIEEAQQWFDEVAFDYNFFEIAGMNRESYFFTNDDGTIEMDYETAHDDFVEWWNSMTDIEQVELYRNYK